MVSLWVDPFGLSSNLLMTFELFTDSGMLLGTAPLDNDSGISRDRRFHPLQSVQGIAQLNFLVEIYKYTPYILHTCTHYAHTHVYTIYTCTSKLYTHMHMYILHTHAQVYTTHTLHTCTYYTHMHRYILYTHL